LQGRHLIEIGLAPGQRFGGVLDKAFEAQLEGDFKDLAGAFRWLGERGEFEFSEDVKDGIRSRSTGQSR
jgi:hypothetical protein